MFKKFYVYLHVLQDDGDKVCLNKTNISLWMSTVRSSKYQIGQQTITFLVIFAFYLQRTQKTGERKKIQRFLFQITGINTGSQTFAKR